jgi:indole-3-glycerol phosphate synthase
MRDILERIVEAARERSVRAESVEPYERVREHAWQRRGERRGFASRLRSADGTALIAEIKRASPSAGLLAHNFDPVAIARVYSAAGADAMSVLTEPDHFLGDLDFLDAIRPHTELPLLRKDFLTRPYDVAQSAARGADAILLIVASLDDESLAACLREAAAFDLDALVEVHDEHQLERALALGAAFIGVNNRDLRTLTTDLANGELLLPRIPSHVLAVSESGIQGADDVMRLRLAGARGILVGESLMRAESPAELIASFKSVVHAPARS